MLQRDPLDPALDLLVRALSRCASFAQGRAPIAAMLALFAEAQDHVTDPPGSVILVADAVRDAWEGRADTARVAQAWSSLAQDLSRIEAERDGRDVHLAWSAWNLSRTVAALDEATAAVASARGRDFVRSTFRVMTWDGEGTEDPSRLVVRRDWSTGRLLVDRPAPTTPDRETIALRDAVGLRMLHVVREALANG